MSSKFYEDFKFVFNCLYIPPPPESLFADTVLAANTLKAFLDAMDKLGPKAAVGDVLVAMRIMGAAGWANLWKGMKVTMTASEVASLQRLKIVISYSAASTLAKVLVGGLAVGYAGVIAGAIVFAAGQNVVDQRIIGFTSAAESFWHWYEGGSATDSQNAQMRTALYIKQQQAMLDGATRSYGSVTTWDFRK